MTRIAIAALLLGLFAGATARAGSLAGVELPDTVSVDGVTLVLNGIGLREATFLRVKAYVGALYLEKRSSDPQEVIGSQQRKQVMMEFLRDIDRDQLASGWTDSLRKIGGETMQASISQFASLIDDVKRSDKMSFTWRPGTGLEVAARGKVRGTVPGDDFARTLFTVWFGPEGDKQLKSGMLGKT
jgi:Chalcone isomerase-like